MNRSSCFISGVLTSQDSVWKVEEMGEVEVEMWRKEVEGEMMAGGEGGGGGGK